MDAEEAAAGRRSIRNASTGAELRAAATRFIHAALAGAGPEVRSAALEGAVAEVCLAVRGAQRLRPVASQMITAVAQAGIEGSADFVDEGVPDPALAVARGTVAVLGGTVQPARLAEPVITGVMRSARVEKLDILEMVEETATGIVSGAMDRWRVAPAARVRGLAERVIAAAVGEARLAALDADQVGNVAFAGAHAGAGTPRAAAAVSQLQGRQIGGVVIVQLGMRCPCGNVLPDGVCQYPPCEL